MEKDIPQNCVQAESNSHLTICAQSFFYKLNKKLSNRLASHYCVSGGGVIYVNVLLIVKFVTNDIRTVGP